MPNHVKISVTRSFLPPKAEFDKRLADIWASYHLTNNGPQVQELEGRLKDMLGAEHFFFMGNGTIALQIAIRALDLIGEVITTPFSYVASTTSILWERCVPVYADIDPATCCIDPARIEERITPRTSAILATHVYGLACDVEAIQAIADKHGLKVIYDGAHAFGSTYKGRSLMTFGDITTGSFHATKIFHTVEGGCIVAKDPEVARRVLLMRQFGHSYDDHFLAGVNGKNSEFHAAMGLCVLDHFPEIMADRAEQWLHYAGALSHLPACRVLVPDSRLKYNHSSFPLLFVDYATMARAQAALLVEDILPRRYFYPSLDQLPYLQDPAPCPVSRHIAESVLCLPLYHGLAVEDRDRVIRIIREAL
ncbi:MAG: DegT/DnrJ/EryC1/StrS family aminotransferase [Flavobacteriales bacterium]|nr:DegT/DnrJ/EryC1/StrS family aminotransferase [Flavobacteriales bacterium]